MAKLPDVHFGPPSLPHVDWRKRPDNTPDDDELRPIAKSTRALIGFDPRELETRTAEEMLYRQQMRRNPGKEHSALKQASTLVAKADFQFQPPNGRVVKVRKGDRFWITSSSIDQDKTGTVAIARERQNMHYDYRFKPEQLTELFNVQEKAALNGL